MKINFFIGIIINIMPKSLIDANNNETSAFMTEYQNKRMKMWHPYADIIADKFDNHMMTPSMAILLQAIEFVENKSN